MKMIITILILMMTMVLVTLSTKALEGGSVYDTSNNTYMYLDNFNGTDRSPPTSQTALTGQVYTLANGNFSVVNQTMYSGNGVGSAVGFLFSPNKNYTGEYWINFTNGTDHAWKVDVQDNPGFNAGGTVYRMGFYSNGTGGQTQCIQTNMNYVPAVGTMYVFKQSVNITGNAVNCTLYTVSNVTGNLVYTEVASVGWIPMLGVGGASTVKTVWFEADAPRISIHEAVHYNYTNPAFAQVRPPSSVDTILPVIVSTSFNNTNLFQGDGVNFSANITDNAALSSCQFSINQSNGVKQFFNKSISGTSDQCNQNFTISVLSGVINFSLIVNDSSNNKAFYQQILFVGDNIVPSITYLNFSLFSITNGDKINVTVNATDNGNLKEINFTIRDPNGLLFNRTCLNIFQSGYICNVTLFAGFETAINGIWNLTMVSAMDTALNLVLTMPNITFTVNPASGSSSSGGGGGGGGGGGIITQTIINQTNVTENCNFNKVCEGNLGEDAFGCPSDCKLNTNFLTCDDPTQRCITDSIKSLYTSRSQTLNILTIIGIVALAFVFIPNDSPIGRFVKQPLFGRKKK